MEEFNLDLTLDEAAQARIDHADFLNFIKNWACEMGDILEPFNKIMAVLVDNNRSEEEFKAIQAMFPLGLRLTIKKMNELYNVMQDEAVKVLGGPFDMQDEHHPQCNGTKDPCGHQDHWKN